MTGPRDRVWLNGRIHETEATVEHLRRAVRYGDGLFATLRIETGRLLDADRHAARLLSGAAEIGLDAPPGLGGEIQIVERLVVAAGALGATPAGDCVLRCQWSAVDGGRGYGRSGESVELIELSPAPTARTPTVRVLDSDAVPRPSIPHVKTCSALPHVLAASLAHRLESHEVIRVYDGWLAEGIVANLFFERDGRLFTPESGLPLYPGITREIVIEQAIGLGIDVVEGRWTSAELQECDAAFLTGSIRGVECIAVLDDRSLEPTPLFDLVARATADARAIDGVPLHGEGR